MTALRVYYGGGHVCEEISSKCLSKCYYLRRLAIKCSRYNVCQCFRITIVVILSV